MGSWGRIGIGFEIFCGYSGGKLVVTLALTLALSPQGEGGVGPGAGAPGGKDIAARVSLPLRGGGIRGSWGRTAVRDYLSYLADVWWFWFGVGLQRGRDGFFEEGAGGRWEGVRFLGEWAG